MADLVFLVGKDDDLRLQVERDITRLVHTGEAENFIEDYIESIIVDELMKPEWKTVAITSSQAEFSLVTVGIRYHSGKLVKDMVGLVKPERFLIVSFLPDKFGMLQLEPRKEWPPVVYSTKILQALCLQEKLV